MPSLSAVSRAPQVLLGRLVFSLWVQLFSQASHHTHSLLSTLVHLHEHTVQTESRHPISTHMHAHTPLVIFFLPGHIHIDTHSYIRMLTVSGCLFCLLSLRLLRFSSGASCCLCGCEYFPGPASTHTHRLTLVHIHAHALLTEALYPFNTHLQYTPNGITHHHVNSYVHLHGAWSHTHLHTHTYTPAQLFTLTQASTSTRTQCRAYTLQGSFEYTHTHTHTHSYTCLAASSIHFTLRSRCNVRRRLRHASSD